MEDKMSFARYCNTIYAGSYAIFPLNTCTVLISSYTYISGRGTTACGDHMHTAEGMKLPLSSAMYDVALPIST